MAILKTLKKLSEDDGATEQINGREGETATLLSKFFGYNSKLRGVGFAPRHLNRSLFLVNPKMNLITNISFLVGVAVTFVIGSIILSAA